MKELTGLAFIFLLTGTIASYGDNLSASDIRKRLITEGQMTAYTPKDKPFKLSIRPDGTAERQSQTGMVKGSWSLEGNQICFTWSDIGGPLCNSVSPSKGRYEFIRNGKLTAYVKQ